MPTSWSLVYRFFCMYELVYWILSSTFLFLFMTHFSSIPWERGTFVFVCVCICMRVFTTPTHISGKLHIYTHTHTLVNDEYSLHLTFQWGEGGGRGVLKQGTQDGYWYIDWMILKDPGTNGLWEVNETYLQACWFTEPVWAGSKWLCVWITQVERMKNVVVSVEAEVWDSAGTWSDQYAAIVPAGKQCCAGQHNLSLSLSHKKSTTGYPLTW